MVLVPTFFVLPKNTNHNVNALIVDSKIRGENVDIEINNVVEKDPFVESVFPCGYKANQQVVSLSPKAVLREPFQSI